MIEHLSKFPWFRPTRRSLFSTGLASAAAAFALPELLAAADPDQAHVHPGAKVEPEKYPWGDIRWLMNGVIDPRAEITMGLVRFEPNQSNVLHIHPNSAEILYALSGSAEHQAGSLSTLLKPGDTLRIPRGVPHQSRSGDQGFTALIVYDTPTRIMVPVTAPARP
jgi:quercetin dioxygenase-like cupin family protein